MVLMLGVRLRLRVAYWLLVVHKGIKSPNDIVLHSLLKSSKVGDWGGASASVDYHAKTRSLKPEP